MPSEFTREDYEHAARAAGLEVWSGQSDNVQHGVLLGDRGGLWCPPDDDGDALRLAVKLKLLVDVSTARVQVVDGLAIEVWERTSRDPVAATRHAIFRAAIEIGKSMKGAP